MRGCSSRCWELMWGHWEALGGTGGFWEALGGTGRAELGARLSLRGSELQQSNWIRAVSFSGGEASSQLPCFPSGEVNTRPSRARLQ